MRYPALVFDLDGTLVDSPIDFAGLRQQLGLLPQEPILEALSLWPEPRRQWGLDLVHQFEHQAAALSKPIHGAFEFLNAAKTRGTPIAIFTRNSRATAEATHRLHDIPHDFLITRDDSKPKPDPTALWMIAKEFRVEPAQLLFVGDYLYDLQAGLRAGTPTALYLKDPPDFETADRKSVV